MSDWREQLRAERERYRQATADEATDTERGITVDLDAPAAPEQGRRRAAIQALIDRGATGGERDAARAAMARLDAPDGDELARLERDRQDGEDFEDAMSHGAA